MSMILFSDKFTLLVVVATAKGTLLQYTWVNPDQSKVQIVALCLIVSVVASVVAYFIHLIFQCDQL